MINLRPLYNLAPATAIDVVRLADTGPELVPMRWSLIPGWWKKTTKEVPSTFNARAETVAEKPMFRSAFKRTRCIVPASGYYEWRLAEGGKQPYFISAEVGTVLSITSLWDEWRDPETRESVASCTLIDRRQWLHGPIHDSMLVLLGRQDNDAWLAGKAGAELFTASAKRVNLAGRADDDLARFSVRARLSY